jgi:hypothetical protein
VVEPARVHVTQRRIMHKLKAHEFVTGKLEHGQRGMTTLRTPRSCRASSTPCSP